MTNFKQITKDIIASMEALETETAEAVNSFEKFSQRELARVAASYKLRMEDGKIASKNHKKGELVSVLVAFKEAETAEKMTNLQKQLEEVIARQQEEERAAAVEIKEEEERADGADFGEEGWTEIKLTHRVIEHQYFACEAMEGLTVYRLEHDGRATLIKADCRDMDHARRIVGKAAGRYVPAGYSVAREGERIVLRFQGQELNSWSITCNAALNRAERAIKKHQNKEEEETTEE